MNLFNDVKLKIFAKADIINVSLTTADCFRANDFFILRDKTIFLLTLFNDKLEYLY